MRNGTVPSFCLHGILWLCARGLRRYRLKIRDLRNLVVILPIHLPHEAVATSWDSRDPAGIFSGVGQAIAESLNGGIQSVVEVDEGVTGPELVSEFLARDHFAIRIQQQAQNTEALFPHLYSASELS